ncbi:MAG: 4Fe-4S binding protein [Nannocystis sp.]|uniref:NADH-quinone oxidoreductase subunit B family protein n=1 Tax=Nannocystis sp. TaxID=1962667 RepID=UPI0024299C4E|nr:4Fe-4S binding protein [Nannocystis sp.]MBK9752197.1 4Fe-4S binding protein [Nannocystis sp.]
MLHSIRVRRSQGWQFIPDVRAASPKGFRGLPHVAEAPCREGCSACRDLCPTSAIALDPFRLDLGLCVFCGECADVCPDKKLSFSNDFKMASTSRETLVRRDGDRALTPLLASATFKKLFGRSLKLRQVSAGGCNGCELELNASANVNFDMGRWGIDWVASPRHADGLVLSGPITANMAEALRLAWDGMPAPKLVIAAGSCAISGAPYQDAYAVDRSFLGEFTPQLYIPGCPPHPLTFVNGLLDLLGVGR